MIHNSKFNKDLQPVKPSTNLPKVVNPEGEDEVQGLLSEKNDTEREISSQQNNVDAAKEDSEISKEEIESLSNDLQTATQNMETMTQAATQADEAATGQENLANDLFSQAASLPDEIPDTSATPDENGNVPMKKNEAKIALLKQAQEAKAEAEEMRNEANELKSQEQEYAEICKNLSDSIDNIESKGDDTEEKVKIEEESLNELNEKKDELDKKIEEAKSKEENTSSENLLYENQDGINQELLNSDYEPKGTAVLNEEGKYVTPDGWEYQELQPGMFQLKKDDGEYIMLQSGEDGAYIAGSLCNVKIDPKNNQTVVDYGEGTNFAVQMNFDENGNLIRTQTSKEGKTTITKTDDNGALITQMVDENGKIVYAQSGSDGKPASFVLPDKNGEFIEYSYTYNSDTDNSRPESKVDNPEAISDENNEEKVDKETDEAATTEEPEEAATTEEPEEAATEEPEEVEEEPAESAETEEPETTDDDSETYSKFSKDQNGNPDEILGFKNNNNETYDIAGFEGLKFADNGEKFADEPEIGKTYEFTKDGEENTVYKLNVTEENGEKVYTVTKTDDSGEKTEQSYNFDKNELTTKNLDKDDKLINSITYKYDDHGKVTNVNGRAVANMPEDDDTNTDSKSTDEMHPEEIPANSAEEPKEESADDVTEEEPSSTTTEEPAETTLELPQNLEEEYAIEGNPDDEYGLKEQSDGKYSVAGMDNLEPVGDFNIDEIEYGSENQYEFTDEDGNSVVLYVENNNGNITYNAVQSTDTGSVMNIYDSNENKIDITNYDNDSNPQGGCTIMYNESGTVRYWEIQSEIVTEQNEDGTMTPKECKIKTIEGEFTFKSGKFYDSDGNEYDSQEDAIPSYKNATSTNDSETSQERAWDRNDLNREAITNHDNINDPKNNWGKDETNIKGTQFDLDIFHDKYKDKYTKGSEEYTQAVANDVNATLAERYDCDLTTDEGKEKLADVYQTMAESDANKDFGFKTRDSFDSNDAYIDYMSKECAKISWDGTMANDYLDLNKVDEKYNIDKNTSTNTVYASEDTDNTENSSETDTDNTVDESGTTEENEAVDDETKTTEETEETEEKEKTEESEEIDSDEAAEEEVTVPEDLNADPDGVYGINSNDDGTYTIAGVEGLTPAENEDCSNLEDGKEHKFTKTDENGNEVNVTVQVARTEGNAEAKVCTVKEESADGTTITKYDPDTNGLITQTINANGKTLSTDSVNYDDNGKVKTWAKNTYETDEVGDSITHHDGSDGSYMQVTGVNSNGDTYTLYYDKDGEYVFDSADKAKNASKAIKAYKDAGIDKLTPSQKLLLGEGNSLDELMVKITNGEDVDADKFIEENSDLIEKVKDLTEDSTVLKETLSEEERANLSDMMEYYDMIMGVYSNLPSDKKDDIKDALTDFEKYFKHVFNGSYFNGDLNSLKENLEGACYQLGIQRKSDNKDGYEKSIEYTVEYEDIYGYKVKETFDTKAGSNKKTKTIVNDDGTIRTYEYENGKCIRRTDVKKGSDGNVAEKTVIDDYHTINVDKTRESTRKTTIVYDSDGNVEKILVTENGKREKEYRVINDEIVDLGGVPINDDSILYQYIKLDEEDEE